MKNIFWNINHYDIRSWISTCGCSFAKDGRTRRKRGIHNPLDLGRYHLHVVSVDLCSWLSKVYLTLLDLYSDKIWALQIYGKSARVETKTLQMFCDTVGLPTEVLTDRGGKFVGLKDVVSLHWRTAAYRPQSNSRLERKHREIDSLCRTNDISSLDGVLLLNDDNVERSVFLEKIDLL